MSLRLLIRIFFPISRRGYGCFFIDWRHFSFTYQTSIIWIAKHNNYIWGKLHGHDRIKSCLLNLTTWLFRHILWYDMLNSFLGYIKWIFMLLHFIHIRFEMKNNSFWKKSLCEQSSFVYVLYFPKLSTNTEMCNSFWRVMFYMPF